MSHLKFDSRAVLQLPSNNPENHKMYEILKNTNLEIHPFINNSYVIDEGNTFDVSFGPFTPKVFNGIERMEVALEGAKNFHYKENEYAIFAKSLQKQLSDNLDVLLHCYCSTDFDKDILKTYIDCLTCQSADVGSFTWNKKTIHCVFKDDHDALFHISHILHLLSSTYQGRHSSGLILLCQSQSLIVVFHFLTHFISKANPPSGLFSFIPCAHSSALPTDTTYSIYFSFTSLFMVFQSADIDATASSCMRSIITSKGARHWKPNMILVEEAIEDRFIKRLSTIMELQEEKTQSSSSCPFRFAPHLVQNVREYVENMRTKFGVTVIEPENRNMDFGPVILKDVTPSVIKAHKILELGPLVNIVSFRTVKEALSIASYFASSHRPRLTSLQSTAGTSPLIAELWSESSSLIWQIFSYLCDAGIMTVFVNTPYQEKAKMVYSFFPRNFFPMDMLTDGEVSNPKMLNNLTNYLNLASKAQASWYNQGFLTIRNKMYSMFNEKCSLGFSRKHLDAIALSNRCLKEDLDLELISKSNIKQSGLLVAKSCFVPVGPVLMVLDKSLSNQNEIDSLLATIIKVLVTGNSVIILLISDGLSEHDERQFPSVLLNLRESLPSNLLNLQYANITEHELTKLFSYIQLPGSFIFLKSCESVEDGQTDYIYSCTFPLVRQARLFWSIGGDLFAN